jgi:XTP/dITP diphosphohydrolase/ATP diphosphatase
MPAMLEAATLGSRASKVGFDWPTVDGLFAKLDEEIAELKVETGSAGPARDQRVSEEFGDLLFTAVNLARHLKVDAESALRAANAKFRGRFKAMEAAVGGFDALASLTPAALDALWNQAKRERAARGANQADLAEATESKS